MTDPAFPIEVVRSQRARRMGLRVDSLGSVRLTLPHHASLRAGYAWAATKQDWVEAQLARIPRPQPIEAGMMIDVAGETLLLDWQTHHPRTPRREGVRLTVGGPEALIEQRVLRWLKAQARTLLTAETFEFAQKAGVSIASVGIGDPRSRWGSCAASGAIRYSWRLILAPTHVRRATVAHEVAHRVHMDHSPRFHALHARLLGEDPAPARRWLRANAARLHGFGRAASGISSVGASGSSG